MVEWAKLIWHNALPKRASVVIWKALSGSLSFDDRIRQVGVAMVSRCNCCITGHEEDAYHVLSTGDFADEHLANNVTKTRVLTREEEKTLTDMGIPCIVGKQSPVCFVTWKKPIAGRVKINVDGSSLGNPGRAASNNEAELKATIEGLKLCQHIGAFHVDLECDSKIVVDLMLKRKCTVWYLWDFWEQLWKLMSLFEIHVSHQVADLLAKMGAQGITQLFTSSTGLPVYTRGLVRLERIGVPYLRM
ncbi:unnamed protein product [Fraxinus pennsylvanica]|uniref:RNase H type-1 domain-containing protein n=1 Tax=Fraxinus pennsylvanica TaxID=56036 RepID=A0AAD2DM22_9LAMI|nr:unnamed protein product [Fraxinus pennsylvanica]